MQNAEVQAQWKTAPPHVAGASSHGAMDPILEEPLPAPPFRECGKKLVLFIGLSTSAPSAAPASAPSQLVRTYDSAQVAEELAELRRLFVRNADVAAAFELLAFPFDNSVDVALGLIAEHKPALVQFSGHTQGDGGGLFFERGRETMLPAALGERIRGFGVEGVVLNGCGTAVALESIVRPPGAITEDGAGPWFAVGHTAAVRVLDARRFSTAFYAELGRTGKIDAAVAAVRSPLTVADQSVVQLVHRARPPPFFTFPAPIVDEGRYASEIRRTYGNMQQLADALYGSEVDGASFPRPRLTEVFIPPIAQRIREEAMADVAATSGFSSPQVAMLIESGQLEDRSDEGPSVNIAAPNIPHDGPLPSLLFDNSHLRHAVFLGDAGSGKSWALRSCALLWANATSAAARSALPLPLLVELRQFAEALKHGRAADLVSFIANCGSVSCRMDANALRTRLSLPDPHVVLLLDGLDEIFEAALRDAVLRAVRELCSNPGLRIIVTSRILGYRRSWLREWDFAHYRIQPLSETQADAFITRWHEAVSGRDPAETVSVDARAERLRISLRSSSQLRELACNPLLLTMIAIINWRHKDLPSRRAGILEECARLFIHNWRVDDAISRARTLALVNITPFDFARKSALLADIAWAMQGNGGDGGCDGAHVGNLVQREALHRLLERHAAAAFTPPTVAAEILQQLHDHHGVLNFLGGTSYAFVHRAFLEFFCAQHVASLVGRTWTVEELCAWFGRRAGQPEWAETLTLLCGLIPSADAGPCLSVLADAGKLRLAARCIEQLRDRRDAGPHVDRVRHALLQMAFGARSPEILDHEPAFYACKLVVSLWHDDVTRDALIDVARSTHPLASRVTLLLLHQWAGDALVEAFASDISTIELDGTVLNRNLIRIWLPERLQSMLQLRHLDLGDGQFYMRSAILQSLPIVVPRLRSLRLQNLNATGIQALAMGLRSALQLELLHLQFCTLDESSTRVIVEGLRLVRGLKQLVLRNIWDDEDGTLADADARRFSAEILPLVPQLEHLDLACNDFGEDGTRAVIEGLRWVPRLQHLDISRSSCGGSAACALTAGLQLVPHLRHLVLINCGLGEDGSRFLAGGLRSVPKLQHLNLWSNELGEAGTRALSEGLRSLSQLHSLDLGSNSIGGEGCFGAITDVLRATPALQHLELRENRLTEAGSGALAEGLRFVPRLTRLGLMHCEIGMAGARAIAAGMRSVPQLVHLELGNNALGAAGCIAFVDGLREVSQLQHLSLFENQLGDSGVRALAEHLSFVPQLVFLDLKYNGFGVAGTLALAEGLRSLRMLQHLDIDFNPLGREGCDALITVLRPRPNSLQIRVKPNVLSDLWY